MKTEEGWVQVGVLLDKQLETHIVKKSTPRFKKFLKYGIYQASIYCITIFYLVRVRGLFGLQTFASPTISSTDGPSLSQTHVVGWNGKQTKLWKENA